MTPPPVEVEPALAAVIESLDATRWSSMICDDRWRLVWVSREHRQLLGATGDEELGIGSHILEALGADVWQRALTEESMAECVAAAVPFIAEDGATGVPLLPDVHTGTFRWRSPAGLPPAPVAMIGFHLRRPDGSLLGTVLVFGSPLRPVVNDLLIRGDESMLERMAALVVPRRVSTAILFADVQDSSLLARRLSHRGYFTLLRELMTSLDAVVVDCGGVIGKHAGDGVSAFFPVLDGAADHRGVAELALRAARDMQAAARSVVGRVGGDLGVEEDECRLNVGLHWSDDVTLGQLVTGGRLEVTALGSPVNECARVQECARDGALLVSIALAARLGRGTATVASLPARGGWQRLGDLPTATDKARRDAADLLVRDARVSDAWDGVNAA